MWVRPADRRARVSERDAREHPCVSSDGGEEHFVMSFRDTATALVQQIVTRSEVSKIVPGLFVGSKPPPGRHEGIDVIVLAAMEYQPPAHLFPGTEVIHAPLDDAPGRPMTQDEIAIATKAAERVTRLLRAGQRVLVTCALGLNRSSLVAALAMHDVYGMSADEIVTRVRRARGPWALSNPNFEKLLRVVIDVKKEP